MSPVLFPSHAAAPRAVRRGFTLIELLVAIALMMILTGSVVFIFIQAQKIFVTVDAKVQVYQYARYAFDQMERDLANVVKTDNMEFFNDKRGGFPPPPPATINRYTDIASYREAIPIRGTFNENDDIYNHALTVRQPSPYPDVQNRQHRHDSLYFKTITVVNGETSAALVEYGLVNTARVRPKLIKRLWRVTDDTGTPDQPNLEINQGSGQPDEQDLCLYTTDVKFELFVRNRRRSDSGDFYDPEQLVNPPRHPVTNRRPFEPHRNWWTGIGSGSRYMVQCRYDDRYDSNSPGRDLGLFSQSDPNQYMRTNNTFSFPMLREGDRIFLEGMGGGGGGATFRDGEYTIEGFYLPNGDPFRAGSDDPNNMRIKFLEQIQGIQGPQYPVAWAVPWVPPALRCTLRIKDAKALELRTVIRVFKILAS